MYSGQTEHPRDEFITLYIYSEGTGTEFLEHNSEKMIIMTICYVILQS